MKQLRKKKTDEQIKKWKAAKDATKLKRLSQKCRVFQLKIDSSHLSRQSELYLNTLFIQAKWFYNNIVADVIGFDFKTKEAVVFDKDKKQRIESITHLSSQMRQGLVQSAKNSIKSLSAKKKKGFRVGRLKFKSQVVTIPLNQHKFTFTINDNRLSLQGCPHTFRLSGADQILDHYEIACAKLIRCGDDYYLHVTTFESIDPITKVTDIEPQPKRPLIGLDMGITTDATFSCGIKLSFFIQIAESIRKLQRSLAKKQRFGKNWWKAKNKLAKLYRTFTNIKNDISNKLCKFLTDNFIVCYQDELLKGWARHYGKKMQRTILGRIKSGLNQQTRHQKLSSSAATTKQCGNCERKNDVPLNIRIYSCECGYTENRDIHAARNMVRMYNDLLGAGRPDFKPAENKTSARKLLEFAKTSLPGKYCSVKQEAPLAFIASEGAGIKNPRSFRAG